MREVNGKWMLLPGSFTSQKFKKAIREKFKEMEIHKRSVPIQELARKLNPIIRGLINYFHKFWQAGMQRLEWLKPSITQVGKVGEGIV